jgi:hypothetical protein
MTPRLQLRRNALPAATAASWSAKVLGARKLWTADFGGDQYSLGSAFYTYLETQQNAAYFSQVANSDARIESVLPGAQAFATAFMADMLGAKAVRQRFGFSGPGIHIFLPGGALAKRGGVIHVDTEGLSPVHLAQRQRAYTLVLMLQAPSWGGGLHVWPLESDSDRDLDLSELEPTRVRYRPGDALLMPSRAVHQIRPFRGEHARISLTLHGVEVDEGIWETWF